MKINILTTDGKAITQYGVVYMIFTGNNLVVTLENNEQFAIPAYTIEAFDIEAPKA